MTDHDAEGRTTTHDPATPDPMEEPDDAYYERLADDLAGYVITGDEPGLLRGEEAAAVGRALIASTRVGRPSLTPEAAPGERARVLQVRLPDALDNQLTQRVKDMQAHGHRVTASQLAREAIVEFLNHEPAF